MRRVAKALAEIEKKASQERKVGDKKGHLGTYDTEFSFGRFQTKLQHKIDPHYDSDRPNIDTHVGFSAEANLLSLQVQRSHETEGGWTVAQGFDASVRARYDFDLLNQLQRGAAAEFTGKQSFSLETREELFKSWSRQLSGQDNVNISVNSGLYDDLRHPGHLVYVEAAQDSQHDVPHGVRFFGNTTITAQAREGIKNPIRTYAPEPYYDIEGSISRPYPVHILGTHRITVSGGGHLQGYRGNAVDLKPDASVGFNW